MRNLIDAIFKIILTFTIGSVSLKYLASNMQKEAITKVHKGLPSLSSYTNKLTGYKFDENMNYVPIKQSK